MENCNSDKNFKKLKSKKIALIGHMGSGKTIIGKLIAKNFDIEHVDTDSLIESNVKLTIREIFKTKGEKYFREIEEKTILKLNNKENVVLSLGGGAIISEKIRNFLKKNFITVFLEVDLDILIKRLKKNSKRPLILNQDIEKKIKELDIIRRKYYLLADIICKNTNDTKKTLDEFLNNYKKLNEKNN
tara:strand:+ start:374 stop:934 length:561 start_codon:yes stop_codon:yes gene_type:complete